MKKRPLLLYVYSTWCKPQVTHVAESEERSGSRKDSNQTVSHESEKTSQKESPQVVGTDQLKESQPEMAEQTSQADINTLNDFFSGFI